MEIANDYALIIVFLGNINVVCILYIKFMKLKRNRILTRFLKST